MRRVVCVAALGLAACGQGPRQRSEPPRPTTTYDSAGNATAPAAPSVAFNYRYSFGLPAERIAEVQERHAATCEQLGVRRCRITGMLYRVVR